MSTLSWKKQPGYIYTCPQDVTAQRQLATAMNLDLYTCKVEQGFSNRTTLLIDQA